MPVGHVNLLLVHVGIIKVKYGVSCQTRAELLQIHPLLLRYSAAAGLERRLGAPYGEDKWYGPIASHPASPYRPVLEHALGVLVVPAKRQVSGVGREAVPARTALSEPGFAEA